jgi:thioredoxin reductase
LATAEISSGICGFSATVRAQREGTKVKLSIESECQAIQDLAAELTEVDPFQEITFRGSGPRSLEMGAKHCYHTACPVPVGIIKTVEIEAGLALSKDAVIKLSK